MLEPISITLIIAQLILFLYSIILYKFLTLDKNFNFIILSHKQLFKHILFLITILFVLGNFIVFRISRMAMNLDFWLILNKIFYETIDFFKFSPYVFCFAISLLMILFISTWTLFIKAIQLILKRSLLAIYLYISQYKIHYDFDSYVLIGLISYKDYLAKRVAIFTKSPFWFSIAKIIWPKTFVFVEQFMYHFLLPYFFVLDICLSEGILSRIFILGPWLYIYSLTRSFILYYIEMCTNMDNKDLTYDIYGFYGEKKVFDK